MSQRCCLPVARAVRGAALHIICTLQGHYTPDSQRIRSSEPPGWRGLACLCSLFVTPAETEECWSAVTLWARVYIWPQPRVTVCTTGPDPGRGGWPGPPAPTLGLQLQFLKRSRMTLDCALNGTKLFTKKVNIFFEFVFVFFKNVG